MDHEVIINLRIQNVSPHTQDKTGVSQWMQGVGTSEHVVEHVQLIHSGPTTPAGSRRGVARQSGERFKCSRRRGTYGARESFPRNRNEVCEA